MDARPSGSGGQGPPPRWLEFGSYGLLALGAVSGALASAGHVVGDGVDLYGSFWFYWWVLDCLVNLRDPSFTDLMFYPLGKDIFAHTGNNFVDAAIAAPVQALLGFPRYQPWFIGLVLLGNALSFRPLARELLGPSHAAWGASMLWLICPFALFECMTGRVTQAFLWFLPPALLAFLRIGRRPGAPLAAGLLTGLAAWTYWFNGYFLALAMGVLAARALWEGSVRRSALLRGYALAALTCGLVILPGIVGMAGRGEVVGLVADDGGIFDPPTSLANNVSSYLHGYTLLETSGQPMFAYWVWGGGALLWLAFGRDRLRWGAVAVLALLFAIGPRLPIGEEGIVMPHYMVAYRYLPFFDRLWFPYRLVVIPFIAVTLGIGTLFLRAEVWALRTGGASRSLRLATLLPLAVVLVGIVEQHRHLAYPLLHRDFSPPGVYEVIGAEKGGLIELPLGLARISIAWQPVHRQPTFGGMAENAQIFWPTGYKRRLSNQFIRFLRQLSRDPTDVRSFPPGDLARLQAEGFRWVVMDRRLVESDLRRWKYARTASPEELARAPFVAQAEISKAIGDPVGLEGPLVVWDLRKEAVFPAPLQPTPERLELRTWGTEDMPEYELHLRDLGRMREPGSD